MGGPKFKPGRGEGAHVDVKHKPADVIGVFLLGKPPLEGEEDAGQALHRPLSLKGRGGLAGK